MTQPPVIMQFMVLGLVWIIALMPFYFALVELLPEKPKKPVKGFIKINDSKNI